MESPPRKMNTILYLSKFDFAKISLPAICRSGNISCCQMCVKFLRMRYSYYWFSVNAIWWVGKWKLLTLLDSWPSGAWSTLGFWKTEASVWSAGFCDSGWDSNLARMYKNRNAWSNCANLTTEKTIQINIQVTNMSLLIRRLALDRWWVCKVVSVKLRTFKNYVFGSDY